MFTPIILILKVIFNFYNHFIFTGKYHFVLFNVMRDILEGNTEAPSLMTTPLIRLPC